MVKNYKLKYSSIKSYVVGKAILIHIHNICFYGELMVIKVKNTSIILYFCENFMSTEAFT